MGSKKDPDRSMRTLKSISAFMCLVLCLCVSSSGAASFSPEEAARAAQNAVGRVVGDHVLVDQDGKRLAVKELMSKPLVVNLVYTGCGHTCPTIITSLDAAFKESGGLGTAFTALTIGIDTENDTPKRLKAFGAKFAGDFKSWRFATSDRETIDRIAMDMGFTYGKTPGGYDHINLVTIVRDGKVFRQIYGTEISAGEIIQHVSGKTGLDTADKPLGLIDRLKLLCYTYDEKTGKYVIDYAFFMSIILAVIVTAIFIFMILYLFKPRRPGKASVK